ncbi:MAG: hypothetical protein ACHQT7_01805 [Candidatus Levyibacteriota bacterium]
MCDRRRGLISIKRCWETPDAISPCEDYFRCFTAAVPPAPSSITKAPKATRRTGKLELLSWLGGNELPDAGAPGGFFVGVAVGCVVGCCVGDVVGLATVGDGVGDVVGGVVGLATVGDGVDVLVGVGVKTGNDGTYCGTYTVGVAVLVGVA